MNNPSMIQQLRDMKFSAMANELELQLRDPAAYAQVSFDDRLGLLVNAEWNRRQANKLKRRIRDARLDIPSATPEGIEYYEDRRLDKAELVRFATCAYIEEEHHIKVRLNDEETIGITLDAYIPELKLAVTVIGNGTKTEEEAVLVTQHLCKVRGLLFDTVSFKDSAEGVCRGVKKAFQGTHIYITSDNDDDVRTAHRQFFRWKKC